MNNILVLSIHPLFIPIHTLKGKWVKTDPHSSPFPIHLLYPVIQIIKWPWNENRKRTPNSTNLKKAPLMGGVYWMVINETLQYIPINSNWLIFCQWTFFCWVYHNKTIRNVNIRLRANTYPNMCSISTCWKCYKLLMISRKEDRNKMIFCCLRYEPWNRPEKICQTKMVGS